MFSRALSPVFSPYGRLAPDRRRESGQSVTRDLHVRSQSPAAIVPACGVPLYPSRGTAISVERYCWPWKCVLFQSRGARKRLCSAGVQEVYTKLAPAYLVGPQHFRKVRHQDNPQRISMCSQCVKPGGKMWFPLYVGNTRSISLCLFGTYARNLPAGARVLRRRAGGVDKVGTPGVSLPTLWAPVYLTGLQQVMRQRHQNSSRMVSGGVDNVYT